MVADEAGGWRDVVVPETDDDVVAVVNTGALLARWTNDRWRATAHRVVAGSKGEPSRYAIAAFIDPDADAAVAAHPPSAPRATRPRRVLAYLRMKLDEANARADIRDNLVYSTESTPPDVTAEAVRHARQFRHDVLESR